MATKTRKGHGHSLSLQLAAESIAADLGVIRGCTVGKADVQAKGKVVFLDRAGAITTNEKLAVKELDVYTDAKFLDTLMAAAAVAGPRVKTREDHDDSIGARAGFSDLFRRVKDTQGDRVVADIHLFDSYRNRGVVMETAEKNPDEIGLSIDFIPTFEIQGDRAFMRVVTLRAVDIVDQGAITPGGLFLAAGVDTEEKKETTSKEPPPMADEKKTTPSNDEIMAALGALSKTVTDCVAAMSRMTAPAAAPDAELKASVEKLTLSVKEQGEQLKVVTAENAKMKRERALLGFRGSSEDRAKLASAAPEDIEKITSEVKTYEQLVEARVKSEKCSKTDAHVWVMRNHRDAYAETLKARGIYDPAKNRAA